MARSQNRYIDSLSTAITTGASHVSSLNFEDAVNAHGLRVLMSVESEAMEANSNGFWIVYALLGNIINQTDFPNSFTDLDDEDIQGYIWGIGTWMASNQTPWIHTFAPKTSRNLPRNSRIQCQIFVNGTVPVLSLNRVNSIISVFASP